MKFIAILCSVILLTACSTTVTSVKSDSLNDYTAKIGKIYLIAQISEKPAGYDREFMEALSKLLYNKKVETKYKIDNNNTLVSGKDVQEELENFKPDVLLLIRQTYYGDANYASFVLSLYDSTAEKVLWKANVEKKGYMASVPTASDVASKIIEKMIEDQIIK